MPSPADARVSPSASRRDVLRSAAAAAAAFTIVPAAAVRGAEANSKVRVGIVGCGGRGAWIGELFHEVAPAKVVAVHDYFRDRADAAGEKLGVDKSRRHVGLDGYKALVEGDLDAVAIISPPYCHPEQATYALEKGRHVYLAKPVATDVPGTLAIQRAAERVKGKLSVWVDFQTRADEFYRGAAQRVHEGLIGRPICGQCYYHAGRLNPHANPADTSPMARLRNWVFDIALSGDIIVEQNIHVLDVANWFLRAHPVKAHGYRGRKARTDVGDCNDHYVVAYHYPGDVLVDFSSSQFTIGFDDLCTRIYGTLGTVDSHYGGQVQIRAKTNPYKGGMTRQIYREGAVTNIKDFAAAIQSGKPIHNVEESCNSTLTAVLGRTAAERGATVTWDEMIKANERLDPKLELPASGVDWKPA